MSHRAQATKRHLVIPGIRSRMDRVKRLILVLVMSLIANWTGSFFVSLGLTATTHAMDSAVTALEPCHDQASHTTPSPDTTSPHQRHACCPAVVLPHALPQFHPNPSSGSMTPAPTVHAYADVIFSIDKPPKASV